MPKPYNSVDTDKTKQDLRQTFDLWGVNRADYDIDWQEDKEGRRLPGVTVKYLRNGTWQWIRCYKFDNRPQNLRQCYFLLDRLRIAEKNGVQYGGLTSSKEVVAVNQQKAQKEQLLDAYDVLGLGPDDTVDMVRDIYKRKCQHYHPDHVGGSAEKFKRLTEAYQIIMKSRGQTP